MHKMAVLVLGVVLGGCTAAQQALEKAANAKQQANDLQAQLWLEEACDLAVGAVGRNLPREMQQVVLEHCLVQAEALDAAR